MLVGKLIIRDDLVHGNRRGRDFPRRQREKSGANKAGNNNQNNTNTIHVRSAILSAILSTIRAAILAVGRDASPDRQSGHQSDKMLSMARICLQYGTMGGAMAQFEGQPAR
ncbi:MAG: hypothetical protein CBD36_007945 [Candidatus Puniceispirillum sp. TMED176]|nr:MAG: hypothetical protein CBD36_007945 [Candidatus Puniceispirillum sp. TMED176]